MIRLTKRLLPSLCLAASMVAFTAFPASAQTESSEDEVIVQGSIRKDQAMSAYLSGDFETAAIEFKKNARCALRVERNFQAGIESAQNSVIQSQIAADAISTPNPTGGPNGQVTNVPQAPSVAPAISLNSTNFEENENIARRSCEDRGFQMYMLGLSQLKLGELKKAKASFYTAVALRKQIHDAYFRLALLEYQDGNIKKARKQFKALSRLQDKCRKCEFADEINAQVSYLQKTLGEL